jgi:transposase
VYSRESKVYDSVSPDSDWVGGQMGQAIEITRKDHSAVELREAASRTADGAQVRRLLAIALVLEGRSRSEAAEQCGMDRQTLRDWVHRYNEAGIAGLETRHGKGREPFLTEAQGAELKQIVIEGPDPETDGVVRWRCVDLRDEVERRYGVRVNERTIGKWLRKLGLTRLQPRPFHPKKDAAAQEAFKKTLAAA